MMRTRPIAYFMGIFLLVFPIQIYIIGDGLGVGIQSAVLNYRSTYLGTSLTDAFIELNYALSGTIQGKTAVSIMAWFAGFLLLLLGLIALILEGYQAEPRVRRAGYLYMIAGFFFLASVLIQYGPWLSGPAGISVPIGVPLILYFGWWYQMYSVKKDTSGNPSSADEPTVTDDTEEPIEP
jgi:hypothetical protein